MIAKKFCNSTTDLDTGIFSEPDFAEQFIEWLKDERGYAENTCKSYITSVLALGEIIDIPVMCQKKLKLYINEMGNIVSRTNVDEGFMAKLDESYGKNRNIDIIIEVIRHVGAIRLCELIRTKVANDDGKCNYLNLDVGKWIFRTGSTKNGINRDFMVSPEAVAAIRKRMFSGSDYLLLNKDFDPYGNAHSLTVLFDRVTGLNYTTVRKSYIEMSNRDKGSLYVVELANVMGHKPSTQMTAYSAIPPLGCIITVIPVNVIDMFRDSKVGYSKMVILSKGGKGEKISEILKPYFGDVDTIEYREEISDQCYGKADPVYMLCLSGEYVLTMINGSKMYNRNMYSGDCVKITGEARREWSHSLKGVSPPETTKIRINKLDRKLDLPKAVEVRSKIKPVIKVKVNGKQQSKVQ
jgi:hypothetical protein